MGCHGVEIKLLCAHINNLTIMRIGIFGSLIASMIASPTLAQDIPRQKAPVVREVPTAKTTGDYRECRRMLVGPGVNQPEPYCGYRGFVGWQSPIVLRGGTMLVGFSSGYWHASPPTDYFKSDPAQRGEWAKLGMPT